jgi:hypothetical protein
MAHKIKRSTMFPLNTFLGITSANFKVSNVDKYEPKQDPGG